MSKIFKIERQFYGDDGLVSLFRGDDWQFSGLIVERVDGFDNPVDLSQYSASAFFPSASGGADILATAVTGVASVLSVTMPADTTPLVAENSGGEGIYVILKDNAGKTLTVPTADQSIVVLDRGFPS